MELSDAQAEQFQQYHAELMSWNVVANLISKRDQERILTRHFVESALLSRSNDFDEPCDVLDLGTGGGFPGVPLKIMAPHLRLTLLDSKRKKTMFLRDLVTKLDIVPTRVVCSRAETLAADAEFKGCFDVVTSRAVASLPKLLEWGLPFVKRGGLLLAVKGSGVATEIAAAEKNYPDVSVSAGPMPNNQLEHSKSLTIVRVQHV